MRLEADPRVSQGNFFQDVKDWMRRAAQVVNPAANLSDAQALQIAALQAETARGPAFSAYAAASQSWASATTQLIQFNTEEFDTAGAYDSATNYRFQPLVPGYYQINACVLLSGTNLNGEAISIFKNGVQHKRGGADNATVVGVALVVGALVEMNGSSDYVDIRVYAQTSAGAPSTNVAATPAANCFFQGFLARRPI
jgi:hypothetical protein